MVLLKQMEATKGKTDWRGKTAKHLFIPCDFSLVWKQEPTESIVAFLCFVVGIVSHLRDFQCTEYRFPQRGQRIRKSYLVPVTRQWNHKQGRAGDSCDILGIYFQSALPHILHNLLSAIIRKVAWPWGSPCRKPLAIVKWLTFQSLVLKTKDFNHKLARPERPI